MTGFEDIIPANTNPQVRRMIPAIVDILNEHVGRNNQVFSDKIIEELTEIGVHPVGRNGEPVRNAKAYIGKAIQIIRCYHIVKCVASTSKGYYIADNPEDYDNFLRSMNERARSADMVLREAEDDMASVFPDYESKYLMPDYEYSEDVDD